MESSLVSIGKFLSYVLRHKPESIGIQLDNNGWVDIDVLIAACNKHNHKIDKQIIEKIVQTNDKKRYAISSDGLRIRANQGHTIDVDLQLNEIEPPMFLYHGTVEKFINSIFENGIVKGERHHVHLSSNIETATIVAKRRGTPVILKIDAKKMYFDNFKFYKSENNVWLTDYVPIEYIIKE